MAIYSTRSRQSKVNAFATRCTSPSVSDGDTLNAIRDGIDTTIQLRMPTQESYGAFCRDGSGEVQEDHQYVQGILNQEVKNEGFVPRDSEVWSGGIYGSRGMFRRLSIMSCIAKGGYRSKIGMRTGYQRKISWDVVSLGDSSPAPTR
jgi:hypothetical protein